MLDLEFFSLSDAGRVRDRNEDCLGSSLPASPQEAHSRGWLFVLADGVGGQKQGDVASRWAVETLIEGFQSAPEREAHPALLSRLVRKANARIYESGGMATTVVAVAFRHDRLVVSHVGDSRCYRIRAGAPSRLTRDHTVVSDQIRMGILDEREASEAETRHLLSRSLGGDLFVNVEMSDHQLQAGDVVLLCSDGLHGPVQDAEIARIVASESKLETAARLLISLAAERDGSDNISVQLVRVRATERMGMYRGLPYKPR